MPPQDKPRHRSGYRREETEQVEATCLTVALTLGPLMDQMCVVGGLVPSLIIDRDPQPGDEGDEVHVGTNDLDVGLAVALLNDQHLEGDFAAVIAPGLQLTFDERQDVPIEGYTLQGEKASRAIPVCGPASFIVLKALAFKNRSEPKDAYDLIYILRRWPAGISDIAERLAAHHGRYPEIVTAALAALEDDFAEVDSIGPMRAASFDGELAEDVDALAADAHGFVDDLLRACRERAMCD
jgi:Nucleotidyl transferase AbiEii toxin, Type IV TA system